MLFEIKTFILSIFIQSLLKHPGLMESKLFLKVMQVFPERISTTYDRSIAKEGSHYDDALRAGLRNIPNKVETILDLCTGTGMAAFMAAEFFPDARITAIDQSDGMIKEAKNKGKESGSQQIVFKKGNAADLTEPDNHYDLILTSNAPVYLSEAARTLKPGGLFLVAFSFGGPSFASAEKSIAQFLHPQSIRLITIKAVNGGAYVLCEKTGRK